MNSHTVTEVLGKCHRLVEEVAKEGNVEAAAFQEFTKCRDVLSDELVMLLQEAADMKWPFVPEKWQFKNSLTSKDKVNLKDLISENLSQLLAYLKAAILSGQPLWAASAIFLVDRFLYWTDDSRQLLKIARKLHQCYPGTPIAPQVVIRQARVYFSTGKLQKAEYILGNLISNSGSTGCWRYHTDRDRTLVQAVSVQVRGQVLQKLGLWFEAAELICASLVGFYSLPQPDKKGIGTSLGILASILMSIDDKDFHRFRASEDTYTPFLEKNQHRLLSAAEAAKMAVIYSQYASLYVLTNVVTQGTCLLSYTFSAQCPPSEKITYLTLAREAFEIGLLTKTERDVVTSKQELHTFVKAAYALAITHKWLGTHYDLVAEATKVCREASKVYYTYCFEESADRETLCGEIMELVQKVKSLLRVEPYVNSDPGSFIPDVYRASEERTVDFTLEDFDRVMSKFQQHHKSVCEVSKGSCHRQISAGMLTSNGVCLTSVGTATEMANTECTTECQVDKGPPDVQQEVKNERTLSPRPSAHLPRTQGGVETAGSEELCSLSGEGKYPGETKVKFFSSSLSNSVDCSLDNIMHISRNSNQSPDAQYGQLDSRCSTESDGDFLVVGSSAASVAKKHRDYAVNVDCQLISPVKPGIQCRPPLSRQRTPKTMPDQSSIETEEEETGAFKGINKKKSSSSSLGSSFGSLSSWQKLPSLDSEISSDDGHGHPIVQGKVIPTSTNSSLQMSDQKARKSNTNNSIQTPPKTISDQSSIETEDDLDFANLPKQASLNLKRAAENNKERSDSSSLSSSFGSLSSWQRIPSLPSGSSVDDSQVVVAENDISAKQVHKKTEDSSSTMKTPAPRGEEGNKMNVIPTSATIPKTVLGQSTETEEEPDQMIMTNNSVGPRGTSQGKEVFLSSSLSSSFGSSSSWLKVPSLDTASLNSDTGLTGRREGVFANTNVEGPQGHKSPTPLSPVRANMSGGPRKSRMDRAETEAVTLDPIPNTSLSHDIANMNIGNSSNSSQPSIVEVTCKKCFPSHPAEAGVLNDILTRQDYSVLLAGVCHECLMNRLPKKIIPPLPHSKAYGALVLKFSKSTGLWTGRETNIYIGDYLQEGKQRKAFQVQFLHQEELLGSYVGKQYYRFDVTIHEHLSDVERQMSAQYYVTEFNKKLYEKSVTAQIFFIPSEVLLILEGDAIIGCLTVEPYMLGAFSKLTNNTKKVVRKYKAFEYGIAFGHFTYEYSGGKEVVVDLQGWVTEDGKGLTYLTDPQIHTLWKPRSRTSNFHQRGINLFLEEQHGPECNEVCKLLCLGKLQMPNVL